VKVAAPKQLSFSELDWILFYLLKSLKTWVNVAL
jgi:hypothetical protein